MTNDIVRILRIKRTDGDSQHLLLHVTQANASKPLDLKLIATEQEHIYHGDIKGTQIAALKSNHFLGDEDELRDILMFCLLRTRPDGSTVDSLKGLETVAALRKDTFVVTLRKNIGGITQRIASIALVQDDDREEILAFEWVARAVETSEQQRIDLESTQTILDTQRTEITSLKTRLDEFIQIKKEHEDEMLQKFAALLNTKKRKIRELRQMLGHSNVDFDQAMASPQETEPLRRTATSRRSKRKVILNDDDIDMNEAEDMDAQEDTPHETEEEFDDLDDIPPARPTRTASQAQASHQHNPQDHSLADLPPDRELPFKSRSRASNGVSTKATASVPDDDETDDEL